MVSNGLVSDEIILTNTRVVNPNEGLEFFSKLRRTSRLL